MQYSATSAQTISRAELEAVANTHQVEFNADSAEGKRIERAVRIYTDALLNVDGADNNGDVLVWQGRHYRVIAVAPYRSNVISHYRYLAAEAER